jgi:hypothetical protein
MEKSLQAIAGRLEKIEGHPALTLTPERFQADTLLAARLAAGQIIQPFTAIEQEAQKTIDELKEFAGRMHTRRKQQMDRHSRGDGIDHGCLPLASVDRDAAVARGDLDGNLATSRRPLGCRQRPHARR